MTEEQVTEAASAVADAVRQSVSEVTTRTDALLAQTSEAVSRIADVVEVLRAQAAPVQRDPQMLPGSVNPLDSMRNAIESRWWDDSAGLDENRRRVRANLELVGMLFDGAGRLSVQPLRLEMSDDLKATWRAYLFEHMPPPRIVSEGVDDAMARTPRTRAMDTQETGYGAELVGAQYVSTLWEAARRSDGLLQSIPEIQMGAPTVYVPIDGALPEMLLVGESTTSNATPYPDSKAGTGRRTLTAKKFTIQMIWSAELSEDSIIAFADMLRTKLGISYALHLASAVYNGDETNAATGNINSDDADPADTRHYLAWDGIRHYWLVDDPANGVNGTGGAISAALIYQARAKLYGANNSVNTIDNIDWGTDPGNLRIVCNPGLYNKLLSLPEVVTVDKLGPGATIVTGQLASIGGVPIIAPAYAPKTEADGKLSATATNNTLGQLSIVNPRGWLRGNYRGFQLFVDRIQRTDQFLIEVYTRQAFTRWGADVAAGVYNVTSD